MDTSVRTAVVTGGSHNIGQGIAITLAKHGYDVAITYRSRKEGALQTQEQIRKEGRRCFIYPASLEDTDTVQKVMDQAHEDLGHIDLLVCNAGNGGFRGSVLSVTPQEVDAVYTGKDISKSAESEGDISESTAQSSPEQETTAEQQETSGQSYTPVLNLCCPQGNRWFVAECTEVIIP